MSKDDHRPRTYSQLYDPPEENTGDTPRTRRRMSKAFEKAVEHDVVDVAEMLEAELGIDGPTVGYGYTHAYVDWPRFLERLSWGDFLSSFSILIHYLHASTEYDSNKRINKLAESLRRIFVEENARLTIGSDGIIHPKIDRAFEYSRAALVRGASKAGYEAVKGHLKAVDNALLSEPPDGASAIRSVFLAGENVFKQMSQKGAIRLGEAEANRDISPILDQVYGSKTHERKVAGHQLKAFRDWINAAHNYRHEEGKPEPSQPPEEMYISLVSEGFAWVRWLIDLRRITSDS